MHLKTWRDKRISFTENSDPRAIIFLVVPFGVKSQSSKCPSPVHGQCL